MAKESIYINELDIDKKVASYAKLLAWSTIKVTDLPYLLVHLGIISVTIYFGYHILSLLSILYSVMIVRGIVKKICRPIGVDDYLSYKHAVVAEMESCGQDSSVILVYKSALDLYIQSQVVSKPKPEVIENKDYTAQIDYLSSFKNRS